MYQVYQGKGKCRQFSLAFCGASQYFSIFFIYLKFTVKTFTKFSNSSLKSLLLPHKREIEKMLESVARPIHPKALMKIDWHFPFPEHSRNRFFPPTINFNALHYFQIIVQQLSITLNSFSIINNYYCFSTFWLYLPISTID